MEDKGGEMVLKFNDVGSLHTAYVARTPDDTLEQAERIYETFLDALKPEVKEYLEKLWTTVTSGQ